MNVDENMKRIEQVVRSLGLSGRALSSRQLMLAVELAHEDKSLLEFVTKGLYLEVAARFDRSTNWRAVERNLRTARDQAWEKADRNRLNRIAGYVMKTKPSTGEFIDMLCYFVESGRPIED